MPTYQCTFIFNSGRLGWTETWYRFGDTYDSALTLAQSLATRRARLMGLEVQLEALRVSDVDIPGDSKVVALGNDAPATASNADPPWSAILCRVNAGALYRRQVWLRGVPDDWIVLTGGNPNKNPTTPALASAFGVFRTALVNGVWLMRCVKKDGAGGSLIDVTDFRVNADGFLEFDIAGLVGVPGQEFRIAKTQGPNPKLVNGVYTIRTNGGGVVVSTYQPGGAFNPGDYANLKAKPRIIEYNPITDGVIMRPAKRSTGRAFFVPRGRRSRRS